MNKSLISALMKVISLLKRNSLAKRIYYRNTTLDDPCKRSFYLSCALLTRVIELESVLHNVQAILSGILQS
jgi:hypothetical protein